MAFNAQPTLADLLVQKTISALNETVELETNGVSGGKAAVTGTWVGTIKFEQSIDDINWFPIGTFSGTTGAILSQTGISTNDIVVFVGIAGVAKIRARFDSYTSGSAVVSLRASNGVSNVFVDNLIPGNLRTQAHLHAGNGISNGNHTRVGVSNSSVPLLADNTSRKYVLISNNSGVTIYLKLGSTAVVGEGITLLSGGSYEINVLNLWTGSINAIRSGGGTATIDVFEGT